MAATKKKSTKAANERKAEDARAGIESLCAFAARMHQPLDPARTQFKKLGGFDPVVARRQLRSWLIASGQLARDVDGNLRLAGEVLSDGGRAALNALEAIENHTSMFVPERLSDDRWLRGLRRAEAELGELEVLARERLAEEAHRVQVAAGGRSKQIARRTAGLVAQVAADLAMLRLSVNAAREGILRIDTGLEEAGAAGRPSKKLRGRLEFSLLNAGLPPETVVGLFEKRTPGQLGVAVELRQALDSLRKRTEEPRQEHEEAQRASSNPAHQAALAELAESVRRRRRERADR